ncbi:hypothetical protein, partial [Oceanidesulfovibrio marinus]
MAEDFLFIDKATGSLSTKNGDLGVGAAEDVSYDNGGSGIASATAQGAIDITYNLALATYLNQIGMVRRPTFQRTGATELTLAG